MENPGLERSRGAPGSEERGRSQETVTGGEEEMEIVNISHLLCQFSSKKYSSDLLPGLKELCKYTHLHLFLFPHPLCIPPPLLF